MLLEKPRHIRDVGISDIRETQQGKVREIRIEIGDVYLMRCSRVSYEVSLLIYGVVSLCYIRLSTNESKSGRDCCVLLTDWTNFLVDPAAGVESIN